MNNANSSDIYKFTGKERDDETGWDYFGARYYYPAIGRWLSVDPQIFPSWTPYNYVFNNPISKFDPNGASGQDVTKFAKSTNKMYMYYYNGRHPVWWFTLVRPEDITDMSKMRYKYDIQLFSSVGDLGYDCSGYLLAANAANPDASHPYLESEIASMEGLGTKRLYDFFSSHSFDYRMITHSSDLQEGDFILKKGGGHALIVVKDADGNRRVSEAHQSGETVGIKDEIRTKAIFDLVDSGEYVGFHDNGNDRNVFKFLISTEIDETMPRNEIKWYERARFWTPDQDANQ